MRDEDIIIRTILVDDQVAGQVISFVMFGEREVSYWLGRDYWGRGIATDALRQLLELWIFRALYARAVKDNAGSIRILEKCGFRNIDQTEKPIEGNSFDFVVNKLPEGYTLTEMQWKSANSEIVNTLEEAIAHGGNGEDGFYISGNGQFSGFFYPDEMRGEEGEVLFRFTNEHGEELIWKKKNYIEIIDD